MDGVQARLRASLRWQLSLVLAAVMFVAAIAAGTFSFLTAWRSANDLQDDTLREIAALALRLPAGTSLARPAGVPASRNRDARVLVATLGGSDEAGASSLAFPAHIPDGFSTRDVGGTGYRVLVQTVADGRRIAVAQETDLRDDAAQDSAVRTVLPLVILAVVLLVTVTVLVRKVIAPITAAAHALDARDQHDLSPLDDQAVPAEVRPFVVALNRLLGRLAATLAVERRFIADAAHELRTPLTAIALQAERLAEAPMPDEARARLAVLRQGIVRGTALLDQLLSLARARLQPSPERHGTPVRAALRRVIEDMLTMAEARNVDIGIVEEADVRVLLSEADLYMLIKNLVDNAIRYGRVGGRVDLAVRAETKHAVIEVADEGPGIADDELESVFAPFYRGAGQEQPGTGIGLAIVASIVDKCGGKVALHRRGGEPPGGMRARVTLPRWTSR
jgi:two-component system OmpR family sensor kinase